MRRSRRKNRAIRSDGRDFCDALISTELKPISNLIIPLYIWWFWWRRNGQENWWPNSNCRIHWTPKYKLKKLNQEDNTELLRLELSNYKRSKTQNFGEIDSVLWCFFLTFLSLSTSRSLLPMQRARKVWWVKWDPILYMGREFEFQYKTWAYGAQNVLHYLSFENIIKKKN